MKKGLLLVILLCAASLVFSQKQGDTLYVAAHSGLNMRTEPGTKAAKIIALPKESMVVVVADVDSSLSYSVTEFPGFSIKGHWVQVDYKGQIGFVFSGYLTSFKPFGGYDSKEKLADPFYGYMSGTIYYLWKNYRLESSTFHSSYFDRDTCYSNWSSLFADGITYRIEGACGESSGAEILEFENHSLQEVYLLYLLQLHNDEINGEYSWDKKRRGIFYHYEHQMGAPWHEHLIYPEGDKIIWVSYGGC